MVEILGIFVLGGSVGLVGCGAVLTYAGVRAARTFLQTNPWSEWKVGGREVFSPQSLFLAGGLIAIPSFYAFDRRYYRTGLFLQATSVLAVSVAVSQKYGIALPLLLPFSFLALVFGTGLGMLGSAL